MPQASNIISFPRGSERAFRGRVSPVEAAHATAAYLPADPALWLERAGLAGMAVVLCQKGLATCYEWRGVEADREQATFLESWLNLTPGGRQAVMMLLARRQCEDEARGAR